MHRWTPIVAGIALVAAALLPAVTTIADHGESPYDLGHTSGTVDGDTFVFKLESDTGFTVKAHEKDKSSKIGLSATYDEKRRDMAFAWAWTDLDDDHTQVLAYDAERSAEETHVKVLSDSEHAIEYNRSKSNGDPLTPGTISDAIKFREDTTFEAGSWHFVVSAPEADQIEVTVSLILEDGDEVSVTADAGVETGTIVAQDDFDGTAQAYSQPVGGAAASVEATAEAPADNRTFATLFLEYTPFVGAAHYGVDGPGDHDAERTDLSVDGEIRHQGWAHIPAGPAGDYTYWVDAKSWAGPAFYADQHHGVLYAAPMPL